MNLPQIIMSSRLFGRLREDDELLSAVRALRSNVEALASTTNRTVPDFTDHTIRHMDALWGVADVVLTASETAALNAAEAFLLTTGFYLHDIGMAYAATEDGRRSIRSSGAYRAFKANLPQEQRSSLKAEAQAISLGVRQLHAEAAKELTVNEIPGSSGRYLFEALSIRETWGKTCGEIAASHHWPVSKLEEVFGPFGATPLPGGRVGDLLYVASCLRLIDYAHINRDRAASIDRAFRDPLNRGSLVHWLAQENIDGPARSDDELIYRAAVPIQEVEA